ncbi:MULTISPECIES: DUF4897 domain-containing protein [Kosmotoga]|jgi:hypothetical protein|uniref:DUF4897 domain-containing protein n=1 Tax=Kosmotoga olearia (strain ATCC BAA-1733 / DSM 21960 / TBF 19.5.1) TaxID=521045 RepID=C5CGJ1_KOSOT|nr:MULTISPECIES: DUF4897 domain-containing protein [Kosmotoga]ACR79573.1 hypothetical protein Kole_0863 [Kosmotoga olearia TBF 19.5.1]MDI3523913.1 hypothetical protein [Kosmotoga sp.]MDK2953308.1 hypothetical protein [Kosmotoga sp.]OAA22122.1 hypothetical protein DU53_04560 [Kosmotoga sp. DU53]
MKFNTLLIIVLVVMIGVTVVNMFLGYSNRLKVETIRYTSDYRYSFDGTVIMDSAVDLKFLKPSQIEKFLEQFQKPASEKISEFQKSLDGLSSKVNRTMLVQDFQSTATQLDYDVVRVEEYAVVKGFATVSDGKVNTSLGDMEINLADESFLTFSLPKNAKIISATPTPSKILENNVLLWTGDGVIRFPEVIFEPLD